MIANDLDAISPPLFQTKQLRRLLSIVDPGPKNLERIRTVRQGSQTVPFVESIFHPSDFSEASELAFAHALTVALLMKCELSILHAGRGNAEDWFRFPSVRKTLERWGVLAPGSPRSAVFKELSYVSQSWHLLTDC